MALVWKSTYFSLSKPPFMTQKFYRTLGRRVTFSQTICEFASNHMGASELQEVQQNKIDSDITGSVECKRKPGCFFGFPCCSKGYYSLRKRQ